MGSTARPSESLLSRLEHALQLSPPQASETKNALELLVGALKEQSYALHRGTEEIESTLFLDPFPYLALLFPLLGDSDSTLANLAREAVDLYAVHSSSKEVVMSLGERIGRLVPAEEESDFGDGGEEAEPEPAWDGRQASRELAHLITIYSKVLPRIKTIRPVNFLSSAVEQILGAGTAFAESGVFASADAAGDRGQVLAADVLHAVASFIDSFEQDAWLQPARETGLPLLKTLLLSTVARLHSHLSVSLAQIFFVGVYPRYRIPGRDAVVHPSVARSWEAVINTSKRLSLSPPSLFALASAKSSSPSMDSTAALGAFIILVHDLAASPNLRPCTLGDSSSSLISKTLRLLMSAFGAGEPDEAIKLGEDEALFWAWWCVQGAVREGEDLDESALFTMVELLSTFSSLSPNPVSRFLAFRLLTTLVLRGTEKEEVQLMILRDLIEDCPFDQMRVASIGLLREVMASKFALKEQHSSLSTVKIADPATPSIFLSPLLLAELSNALLRFEPVDLLSPHPSLPAEPMTAPAFLETHAKSTTEKLSLIYFLLARDQDDSTTIHAAFPTIEAFFLSPLRVALRSWLIEAEQRSELGQVLELEMLNGAVERVDKAVGRCSSETY